VEQSNMQNRLIWLFSLLPLTACGAPSSTLPKVERIEMKRSGWSSLEIEVRTSGEGSFRLSEPFPKGHAGTFKISPKQFSTLVERLQPFQRESTPLTASSLRQLLGRACPEGVTQVTDAGGFWVHWIGPQLNDHYWADFGCDRERRRARNRELVAIMESLPVPQP
jgi:hypothetical protein